MRHPTILTACSLIALLGFPLESRAASEPIVFDFEDGLQGWTLNGAERVQTGALGGEWAIFGNRSASLSIEIDLTEIAFISIDQFFPGEILGRVEGTDFLSLRRSQPGAGDFIGRLSSPDLSNPGRRVINVRSLEGLWQVGFLWSLLPIADVPPPDEVLGFIDNITFHPVPEPSTLGLLGFGLAALTISRRRRVQTR